MTPVGSAREWPADNVQRVPLDRLRVYPKNAKKHPRSQVAALAAMIEEVGWTMPVLVDEQGEIVAGHGRVMAAQLLNLVSIPVMVARGWTEAQIKAYRLADNVIPENSSWDEALLKVEVREIEALNYDIGKIGFDMERLTKLFDDGGVNIQADRDEAGTGVRAEHMKFGKNNVIITEDELTGLERMLARYTDQFGLSHGFAQWLLDAAS